MKSPDSVIDPIYSEKMEHQSKNRMTIAHDLELCELITVERKATNRNPESFPEMVFVSVEVPRRDMLRVLGRGIKTRNVCSAGHREVVYTGKDQRVPSKGSQVRRGPQTSVGCWDACRRIREFDSISADAVER